MAETPSLIRGQAVDEITVDLDNTVHVTHSLVNPPTLLCLFRQFFFSVHCATTDACVLNNVDCGDQNGILCNFLCY